MKLPLRSIFTLGPCRLLDVARPDPAKSFDSDHARHASTVDPIQFALGYFQWLVQPPHSQIRFTKTNPPVPSASEWLLPIPRRDRGRLSAQYPTVIELATKRRS